MSASYKPPVNQPSKDVMDDFYAQASTAQPVPGWSARDGTISGGVQEEQLESRFGTQSDVSPGSTYVDTQYPVARRDSSGAITANGRIDALCVRPSTESPEVHSIEIKSHQLCNASVQRCRTVAREFVSQHESAFQSLAKDFAGHDIKMYVFLSSYLPRDPDARAAFERELNDNNIYLFSPASSDMSAWPAEFEARYFACKK